MAFGDFVTGQHAIFTSAGATTGGVAFTNPVGSGNSVLVGVFDGFGSSQLPTVTDDKGNTYIKDATVNIVSDGDTVAVFRCSNITNGAQTITVTFPNSGSMLVAICEYVGNFALHGTPPTNNATSTSVTSGNQTTTVSCALFGFMGNATTVATLTAGSGWTQRDLFGPAGTHRASEEDQATVQAAGTYAATFTQASSVEYGAILCAYSNGTITASLVTSTAISATTRLLPATETFTGSVGNLADPPWKPSTVSGSNRFVKRDGAGNGTVTGAGTDDIVTWDSNTFNNDQYSQYVAKFTGPGDSSEFIYLLARVTGTEENTWSNYWFWSDGGSETRLNKVVAGSGSTLGTALSTTFVSGDVFRLICNGTTISVTKNGSTIITANDTISPIISGTVGMGGSGTTGVILFDDWEGGNFQTTVATSVNTTTSSAQVIKAICALSASTLITTVTIRPLPATEPFSGASDQLPNPPWRIHTDSVGGRAVFTDGSGLGQPQSTDNSDCDSYWIANTFSGNQYSQIACQFNGPGNGSAYIHLAVRCSGTFQASNSTRYFFFSDGGSDSGIETKVNNIPGATVSNNTITFAVNDVFRMEAVDNKITVYKNGVVVVAMTDSTLLTGGSPGVGGSQQTPATSRFDNWEGGNVPNVPPSSVPRLGPILAQ